MLHPYSKEHRDYRRKPLIHDSYLTHEWNKQSKTPIWLPREVKNFGTLRKILEKWFPTSKDKVIIVFEYSNKDHTQIPVTELIGFKDLSIELEIFNQEPEAHDSTNSPSPSLHSISSTSYSFPSSPPYVSSSSQDIAYHQPHAKDTSNYNKANRKHGDNESAMLRVPSSSSELPTIEQLMATTLATLQINKHLGHSHSRKISEPETPSSPLSTISDSPDWHPLPPILCPIVCTSQELSHCGPTKVVLIPLSLPLRL